MKIDTSNEDITISRHGDELEIYVNGWFLSSVDVKELTPEAMEQLDIK